MQEGKKEQTNRESEAEILSRATELEAILSCIADGVFVYDKKGNIIRSNAAANDMLKYDQNDLKTSIIDRLTKSIKMWSQDGHQLQPNEMPAFRAAVKGETIKATIYRVQGRAGMRWLSISAAPLFVSGKHTGGVISMSDITDRKMADEELERSSQRISEILESIADNFIVLDRNWNYFYSNQQSAEIVGLKPKEIIGKNFWQLFPDYVGSFVEENMREAMEKREIRRFQVSPKYSNEHRLVSVFPSVDGISLISTNITHLKKAEDALKESEGKLLEAQTLAKMGNYTVDVRNNFIDWSEQLYDLWGFDKNKPLPPSDYIWSLIHPDDRENVKKAITGGTRENDRIETEFRILFPDSSIKYISLIARAVFDESGNLVKRWGIEIDITNRKLMEEQLLASLKEKEVLLRELYHRTKNNMQVIYSLLNLKGAAVDNNTTREILSDMGNRILTIALIHQKLYQSQNLSRIDLKDYINDLLVLLRDSFITTGNNVKLSVELESIPVLIDTAIPCGMILNELISNSYKYAFPNGQKGEICVRLSKTEQELIELRISDNGIGIRDYSEKMNGDTLGIKLIKSIVEDQLQGDIILNTKNGVLYIITFKDSLYKERV